MKGNEAPYLHPVGSSGMASHEMWKMRKQLGLTGREFARALGMSPNGYKRIREWEAGRRPIPRSMSERVRRLEAKA
ncbi:helix-turn-helix domain-containing protein [Paracoccus sulfuroxidans]|uniref:HTH cro/C1-type domain-containing protein n=1 Tax=Paracoccus sulfuroxidans TaxID=384678 RepID=A0A562NFX3_9RHOB|nr:helix-turn-helix domain-containing protein [Paracoccus sulfuroxidans]TWI31095.1 hypothetical protein IQ24_03320 [Paracoccus sulfuroxidans]